MLNRSARESHWWKEPPAAAPWLALAAAAMFALWFAAGTQREKPVLASPQLRELRVLEHEVAELPSNAVRTARLANAYLDNHASGAALALLERAPAEVRALPLPRHALARALFEQGRATDALHIAQELHQQCMQSADGCGPIMVSLTQRVRLLEELVKAGVEDANAHPEAAALAWQRATHSAVMVP